MIQWEYKIESLRKQLASELNNFGKEGWELTAVVFKYTSSASPFHDYYDYYFKRQITESK